MSVFFSVSELQDLIYQVERGERLDLQAGIRLLQSNDLLALGYMANLVRERKNGNQTYFSVNHQIDLTNICEKKVSGERWLEIQEAAHRLGMRTNATMLYGHIETVEERIDHLIKLRELQDRTAGFLTFMPLSFYPKNTEMEGYVGVGNTTGFEDLKMLSVSRILLDNIDHIKTFWGMLGYKLAQVSLAFGVDDLDGTVVEEHAAGFDTEQAMSKRVLIDLIKKAGREPFERMHNAQCTMHNAKC